MEKDSITDDKFYELVENYKKNKELYAKPLFEFICKDNARYLHIVTQQNRFSLSELKNFNINKVIKNNILNLSTEQTAGNTRMDFGTLILNEATETKKKGNVFVALILYATWIEHWFNDIINTIAVTKNLTDKETEKLINSSFDAKLSYMLPLFNLPRLDENILKKIYKIVETRNYFIHYKWKPIQANDLTKYFENLIAYVESAPEVIDYLIDYNKRNIFSEKYLYYILASLVFAQTGIDIRTNDNTFVS